MKLKFSMLLLSARLTCSIIMIIILENKDIENLIKNLPQIHQIIPQYCCRTQILKLGRVCIQMSQKKLLMDDKELPFTKAEYEICEFLAKNRGQVFSKEQILEAVFGFDNESNDSTIITHIKNIRAKFADYDYTPIKTVWGIGYKWEE